jgi:5-methylcytosine-specific restriction protein B
MNRQQQALLDLVHEKYPDWENVEHPVFDADELAYKHAAATQFTILLNQDEYQTLLNNQQYDDILKRLETVSKATNLLWRRLPRRGDTAILYTDSLNKAEFALVVRDLLYGSAPAPDRLESYARYAAANHLPLSWPFPTYLFFLAHPQTELFVKPEAVQWWLKFMGVGEVWTKTPAAAAYTAIRYHAHQLKQALNLPDMIAVQSLIWVAFQQAKQRTGRLSPKGQIELDVPVVSDTEPDYKFVPTALAVHEVANMAYQPQYFTAKTFDLMAELANNPTTDFYLSHKTEFEQWVETPFQTLLRDVAASLPLAMTQILETEKRIFAKIPKNDYGQGGAWSFYWGAFYPKGSKRITDAQLSLWIDYQYLEFGFYIGDRGDETRERLRLNCEKYSLELNQRLLPHLPTENILFGSRETITVLPDGRVTTNSGITIWEGWLRNPEKANYDASFIVPKNQLLLMSASELQQQIHETYKQLFPLILLAILDEPLPQIEAYLGVAAAPLTPTPTLRQTPSMVGVGPVQRRKRELSEVAAATGLTLETLQTWLRAIERKGQAVLYGPPGTGKTYVARHLADYLAQDTGFVTTLQFHPAYTYEDFIEGIRPQENPDGKLELKMTPGRFLSFCELARRTPSATCVLILDEINRANLSRVFGELMYLMEYREDRIFLAGSGLFGIPANVRLIGTMNTADRSIALVDHALRRRFAFLELSPNYDLLRHYHQKHNPGLNLDGLIRVLERLNSQIDKHYQVGVTFFMRPHLPQELRDIWEMEILPYLDEYFFDQLERIEPFRWSRIAKEIDMA